VKLKLIFLSVTGGKVEEVEVESDVSFVVFVGTGGECCFFFVGAGGRVEDVGVESVVFLLILVKLKFFFLLFANSNHLVFRESVHIQSRRNFRSHSSR